MKVALWGVFVLLAAVWTGGAALTAQLVEWSAQGLASGTAGEVGSAVAAIAMPAWLAPWFDPAAWAALQQTVGATLDSLAALLPGIGGLVSWLTPLIWIFWGLGVTALLAAALAGHWLIGRLHKPMPAHPQSA